MQVIATNRRFHHSFDIDAQVYFDAGNIIDGTEKNAANTLIIGLKEFSLWTKMLGLYLISPTSLAAAAVNAKNPGTFDIAWINTPTHANTGVTGNGTTQYGRLGVIPSVDMTLGDTHASQYYRTNTQANIIGNLNGGSTQRILFQNRQTADNMSTDHYDTTVGKGRITTANADARGLGISTRISHTDLRTFLDNVQFGSTAITDASGDSLPTVEFYTMAYNNAGSPALFSDGELCFNSVGTGLTSADVANLTALVQTYQTNVIAGGRQV